MQSESGDLTVFTDKTRAHPVLIVPLLKDTLVHSLVVDDKRDFCFGETGRKERERRGLFV